MSWKLMGGRLCPSGPAAAEVNYGPAQWVYYPPQMMKNMRKIPIFSFATIQKWSGVRGIASRELLMTTVWIIVGKSV